MSKERFYCNICKNDTWHDIVSNYEQNFYDTFWGSNKLLNGQILRCRGCDYLSFRLFEHPYDFEDNGEIKEYYFPKRNYEKRDKKYFLNLPVELKNLYEQTINAYDEKLYILAAVGLRTLLEAIVTLKVEKKEYKNSLESKIESLKKHFNDEIIETLHDFRFMGNKATHNFKAPEHLDIHRALNVIENIMTYFWQLEESARIYKTLKEKEDKKDE